jgi:spore maturation protein CgeB
MRELDTLAENVRALLGKPKELREMGERAKQAVLSRHTWRDRLETVLAATSLSSPRVRAP